MLEGGMAYKRWCLVPFLHQHPLVVGAALAGPPRIVLIVPVSSTPLQVFFCHARTAVCRVQCLGQSTYWTWIPRQ
jgi:hypothetical protein